VIHADDLDRLGRLLNRAEQHAKSGGWGFSITVTSPTRSFADSATYEARIR
jgi:hypothetical protein